MFTSISTSTGYGVVDVSHVAVLSTFGDTYVSDNLRLGPSAGHGGLYHHNVDGNGGHDIGTAS